jgi:prolyl-tRNA synthetase
MAPSPAGEDRVALCQNGDYAANVELAVSVPERPSFPPSQAPAEVETPGVGTIEALAAYLGIDARTTMKAVLVVPEDERGGVVLALVRGDHRVHELKLTKALGTTFRPATPEEIRSTFGADPGSIGAVGVPDGALREIVVDEVLTDGAYVAGANRTGWHLRGVEHGRDFTGRVVDIRHAEAGERCIACGGALRIETVIEVGNIFKLGTLYSEALGAAYQDENGREQPIWMGSYGIGPARILASIAEQRYDEHGLLWPLAVAPFDVWITAIGGGEALDEADRIEAELARDGLKVLVDDRALSPGVRFADADLIGVPIRVTVGKRLAKDGTVGVKLRGGDGEESVPAGEAVRHILGIADGVPA